MKTTSKVTEIIVTNMLRSIMEPLYHGTSDLAQWYLLHPLLFIIYNNDLPSVWKYFQPFSQRKVQSCFVWAANRESCKKCCLFLITSGFL